MDPWWDIFLPATFGETACALDAIDNIDHAAPPGRRGAFLAVSARTLELLGRPAEAARMAERAFTIGGDEADALATFVRPSGEATALRRMAEAEDPGDRADAACDLALLRLRRGDGPGASEAIARAEAACADHAEAARWRRFLRDASDPVALVRAASDPRRARRARTPAARDAVELSALRRNGWMSPERVRRRVLGAPGPFGRGLPGGARDRLRQAGLAGFHFALETEYDEFEADHPLVGLEAVADALRSHVQEGRDGAGLARRLWDEACAFDDTAAEDAAHLLVALATQDRRLVPLGWSVADRMARAPGRADARLWRAYRGWLGACLGRSDASDDAWAVLARPCPDRSAWTLAVATLRASGFERDAEAAVRVAMGDPILRDVATSALRQAPRMEVSGRMTPRGAGTAN
jgi:hypothetical protein